MRYLTSATFGVALCLATALSLPAQKLTAHRQFLSLEPYYASTWLDLGKDLDREQFSGYGGRLWINLAPFSGPAPNLVGMGAIALYLSYFPDVGSEEGSIEGSNDTSILHYGVQHDAFFFRRPLGGIIDPFLSVGAGVFRISAGDISDNQFALPVGGGIRIPVPNRFQLRVDVRDAILFGREDAEGKKSTAHNLEIQAALGITF